jgi:hypothetical protein
MGGGMKVQMHALSVEQPIKSVLYDAHAKLFQLQCINPWHNALDGPILNTRAYAQATCAHMLNKLMG